MNRKHSIIYFLAAFANGLTVPFISLICLSHGASIENLSLIISVFAITVILTEVPSGMISDMVGRKAIFVMSQFILALCYVVILCSGSWIWLVIAYILKGVGIAFSSGSLEALIVEEYVENQGKDAMATANGLLLRLDCLGALSGALIGGMIGSMGENYMILLMLRIGLEIFIAVSSCILVNEHTEHVTESKKKVTVWEQLSLMAVTIKHSNIVGSIMWIAFFYGCVVAMMETYWQQNLLTLLSYEFQWIFGVVSCLGYAGAILGGRTGEKIREYNKHRFYKIIRVALPITILLLGISAKWYLFILLYFIIYYIIGVGDLLERNMLHGAVVNECRASMLSVYSLFIRGGGAVSAIVSSGIVVAVGVDAVWIMIPVFVVVMYVVIFTRSGREKEGGTYVNNGKLNIKNAK